jgi:hypothetical protein
LQPMHMVLSYRIALGIIRRLTPLYLHSRGKV